MVDATFNDRSKVIGGALTGATSVIGLRVGRVVFALLLALIVFLPFPYGAVQAWWIALFEVVVFAAAIVWIVEGTISGGWLVTEHRILIPLLAIVLLALVQTVPLSLKPVEIAGIGFIWTISADPFETRQFAINVLAHTVLLGLLLRFTNSRSRLRTLTYVVIGTGVSIALFGLLRFALQPQTGGFLLHYLKGEIGFGPFINRNHFSFLMEMTIGLIGGLAIFGMLGKWKLRLLCGGALLIWVAVSLSNSRGGITAIVCQIMLGFFLAMSVGSPLLPDSVARILQRMSKSLVMRAVSLLAILIVIVTATIWIAGDRFKSNLEMVPTEIGLGPPEDSVRRADIWQGGWQLFLAHPIVGSGFGAFSAGITKYHERSGTYAIRQAHNDYLEILASGGLVAVALGLWFVFSTGRLVSARIRSDSPFVQAARWGAVIGMFGVAIHSFVEFGLHVPGNSVALVAVLAIATADVRPQWRRIYAGPGQQKS